MSKISILLFLCLIYSSNAQVEIIKWDSVNQTYRLPKGKDFSFQYALNKTPCLRVEVEDQVDEVLFTLKSDCISDTDIQTRPPDTLMINCNGDVLRTYKGGQVGNVKSDILPEKTSSTVRTVVWNNFGQKELVKNCEVVTFIYSSKVQPEDADFYYEQVEEGYMLYLKMVGKVTELNLDCLCKKFEVTNPLSYRIKISPELKYEQLIMTPMSNEFWEIRLGSIDRGCKSPAKDDLKSKRDKNYESKLPKCNSVRKK